MAVAWGPWKPRRQRMEKGGWWWNGPCHPPQNFADGKFPRRLEGTAKRGRQPQITTPPPEGGSKQGDRGICQSPHPHASGIDVLVWPILSPTPQSRPREFLSFPLSRGE